LRRVDRLGATVVLSYLLIVVTSGETGLNAGAEGATAPETLRQKDRVTYSIWKETPKGLTPIRFDLDASADGIILSGTATDGAFCGFSRGMVLEKPGGPDRCSHATTKPI
jgi:hypothetical protein